MILVQSLIFYAVTITLAWIATDVEAIQNTVLPHSENAYYLVIKKTNHTLTIYHDSLAVKTFICATGKVPGDKVAEFDNRTPEGNFYITRIEDASDWWHDFPGDGKGPVKGAYGPWFIRLYTGADSTLSHQTWTGIGIHGTNDPASIGKDASEGCIRLENTNLLELKKYARPGLPVRIEV